MLHPCHLPRLCAKVVGPKIVARLARENATKRSANLPPTLLPIARLTVTLAPALTIGDSGAGPRDVIPITGGTMVGERLNGRVVPGGADWAITRADGYAEVWARYTIETNDGVLVMVTNTGLARQTSDGRWIGHTVPSFETGAPGYQWLRQSIFVGSLDASAAGDEVKLEWWRLA